MKPGVDYVGVAVGAMIFDGSSKLFLSKRSQNTKNEKGCWETPGGSVEFMERLEDAVKREMREEYGAEIEILKQFPAEDRIIPEEKQHWVATTFLAKFKDGQVPKIMEPSKCDEIGWFSLKELPSPLSIITELDLGHHSKIVQKE
jgi:ADP-ribose pyrophosphatase YjhB (NUDIX family)